MARFALKLFDALNQWRSVVVFRANQAIANSLMGSTLMRPVQKDCHSAFGSCRGLWCFDSRSIGTGRTGLCGRIVASELPNPRRSACRSPAG